MDERTVRAMLGVMNLTAPFESLWCAEFVEVSGNAKEQGVQQAVRFWLVQDDSKFAHDEGLIYA